MSWGARFPARGHRRGRPARVALSRTNELLIDGELCQVDSFEGTELCYQRVCDLESEWVPLLTIDDLKPHEVALLRVHCERVPARRGAA